MPEKLKFSIAYEGSAVENGTMDVRDLAPALLAVGELFDAANTAIRGQEDSRISVNVAATKSACFEVELVAISSLFSVTKDLLIGDGVNALLNLAGLIGMASVTGGGLFWLIRKLKGKNPDKVKPAKPGMVQITHNDEVFEVPIELLRLYRDIAVRKAVEHLIEKPLQNEGIDEFKIIDAKKVTIETVTKSEASYYISPEPTEKPLGENTIKSAFSIVSLAFKDDNKWRLYDGNNQISASIEDEDFLRKVNQNLIRFAKGDILICEVTIEQIQTSIGLRTTYTVNKVIEHKPALRQLDIFTEYDDDSSETDTSDGNEDE